MEGLEVPENNMNELIDELKKWLDTQEINSENIGHIRRQCFVPWNSEWNSIIRNETSLRENKIILNKNEDLAQKDTEISVKGTLKAFKTLIDEFPESTIATLYQKSGGVPIKKKYSDAIKERLKEG